MWKLKRSHGASSVILISACVGMPSENPARIPLMSSFFPSGWLHEGLGHDDIGQ